MLLRIPFEKKTDREAAKKLGAKWVESAKCWSLPDSTELPEALAAYRVQEILATAEQVVAARVDRACEALKAFANDARLGLKLSNTTKEALGKFDASKGAPDAEATKRLAKALAVRVLLAGGLTVADVRAITGAELLGV